MAQKIREQALALCNRDIRLNLDNVTIQLLNKENEKALEEYALLKQQVVELGECLIKLNNSVTTSKLNS
nr:hypothetical protein [uncultured Flavobacterium sp.]